MDFVRKTFYFNISQYSSLKIKKNSSLFSPNMPIFFSVFDLALKYQLLLQFQGINIKAPLTMHQWEKYAFISKSLDIQKPIFSKQHGIDSSVKLLWILTRSSASSKITTSTTLHFIAIYRGCILCSFPILLARLLKTASAYCSKVKNHSLFLTTEQLENMHECNVFPIPNRYMSSLSKCRPWHFCCHFPAIEHKLNPWIMH